MVHQAMQPSHWCCRRARSWGPRISQANATALVTLRWLVAPSDIDDERVVGVPICRGRAPPLLGSRVALRCTTHPGHPIFVRCPE